MGRVHTPIVSEKQRRLFYHWKGNPEDKPEGITGKEVKEHLKEVEGEKLPKKTKKFITGGDMETKLSFFVPINKVNEEQRMVYGVATCSKLDNQHEIVDYAATKEALEDYSQWRNIREMHKPSAVGVAPILELRDNTQELFIGAKIVDDQAWLKCKEGVYKGFSIGGEVLDRKVELDKASNKTVNRVTKYLLNEISVVDRPANPACKFQTIKRDTSVHTITVIEDPLKAEYVRIVEKSLILAKRIMSKEDLEKLPDTAFGLIKVTIDGDTLIKHRLYPMPDRTHAINMVRKSVGCDELTAEDKARIHDTALLVLGKKHSEMECPYCIEQKLKGGVQVDNKKVQKQVTVTEEPEKKTVTVTGDKPAHEVDMKPAEDTLKGKPAEEKAPEKKTEKPADEQKPHIESDEEADADVAKPESTDAKLDRLIALLESLIGEDKGEESEEDIGYEEDEEGKSDIETAEEGEEQEEKPAKIKVEEEEEDEPAKADVKPAEEEEEEECVKVAKVKTVKKVLLTAKVKAILEPIIKENKSLKARLEKLEKQPLPRKEGKADQKAEKVEKYQDVKLEKKDTEFSEPLQKDISKAQDLRKSGRALTKEEETFCQRVADQMFAEKFSK